MTPEALVETVLLKGADELASALAPLDEPARRGLAKRAYELHRRLARGGKLPVPGRLLEQVRAALVKTSRRGHPSPHHVAALAVLGTGTLTQARRIDLWLYEPQLEEPLLHILRDRRPEWIDAWIEHALEQGWSLGWRVVRTLVREGVCRRPQTDEYLRLMVRAGLWRSRDEPPLSRRLLADPELLEHEIWRLFEIETDAFGTESGFGRSSAGFESWPTALARLADEGHIDRQRLLDATLAGLTTGLRPQVLAGFHKLHARLEPSPDELRARQEEYLHLLGSPVAHVAGFAVAMLGRLEKAGGLDGERLVASIEPVFSLSVKGPPRGALLLAKRVVGRRPELAADAARAVGPALAHPSADVQDRALGLLEAWSAPGGAAVAAAVAERLEHLSAPLCPRAAELTRVDEPPGTPTTGAESETQAPSAAEIRRRLARLDPEVRRRCGLAAVTEGELPPPLVFDLLDVPVLANATPIAPLEGLDELLDAAAHACEKVDSPEEIERLLDGISRGCEGPPPGLGPRGEALARRLETGGSGSRRGLAIESHGVAAALSDLLLTWLTGRLEQTPDPAYHRNFGTFPFLVARVRSLAGRVAARRAAPLLAAPTHAGGWIDPRAVVERLRELRARGLAVDRLDLAQALLRLAPDHRGEALEAAADLAGATGRMLRFALGGDGPSAEDRGEPALWIAAGRAREPRGSLRRALEPLGLAGNLGPDGLDPAAWSWRSVAQRTRRLGLDVRLAGVELEVRPPLPRSLPASASALADQARGLVDSVLGRRREETPAVALPESPTVTQHRLAEPGWNISDLQAAWPIRWAATVWPLELAGHFAAGVCAVTTRMDQPAATFAPYHAFLDPLLDPDRPWGELARLLVATALCARDADLRAMAGEALITGIDDGRVHPQPLGETLVGLWGGGWLKLNRLAEALSPVAEVSALHERVVAGVVEALVASWEGAPRGGHHLLELLLELLTRQGNALGEEARRALAELRGGSKSARLARALSALEPADPAPRRRLASNLAVVARLERAERWQAAAAAARSALS